MTLAYHFVSSHHHFASSHSVMLPFVTLFTIYHQLYVSDWCPRADLIKYVGVMNPYIPISDHIFSSIAMTPRGRRGLQQGIIIALLLHRRQRRVMRRRRQLWVRSIFSQRQQQGELHNTQEM